MISYSWGPEEEGFPCQKRMLKLKEQLERSSFSVWMDAQKMRGNMDEKMATAIERSSVILLCYSEKYQHSKNCKKEAQYADHLNKDLVVLKFDAHRPSDWLGIMICKEIYYDVTTEDAMMQNLPEIKKAIDEKLSLKATQQVPRPHAPLSSHKHDDLIQRIAEDLKETYESNYCKKRICPWKRNEWMDLDDIYVPMTIDDTLPGEFTIKERMKSYADILKRNQDGRRFLLVGDPGRGKSVFVPR
ncbi:uncharacterized protein [Amphiura filiformis]|uniref:uncharacterized protein n=1 Tax=Amphiura filiformis TaxID=82378 RepID=UPI003B21C0AF